MRVLHVLEELAPSGAERMLELAGPLWGVHDVNNHKSSRVMDKLGLAPVRTARHVHLKLLGDVYRDELVRRITADEWLTR